MVYCVGLTPDGKIGIYSKGEVNNLQLFDTKTAKIGNTLVAHKTPVNQIVFINNKELFSSGNRKEVFYWRLD